MYCILSLLLLSYGQFVHRRVLVTSLSLFVPRGRWSIPPKPMMHIAYYTYFSQIYQFHPLIFILFHIFCLPPSFTMTHLHIMLNTYWMLLPRDRLRFRFNSLLKPLFTYFHLDHFIVSSVVGSLVFLYCMHDSIMLALTNK